MLQPHCLVLHSGSVISSYMILNQTLYPFLSASPSTEEHLPFRIVLRLKRQLYIKETVRFKKLILTNLRKDYTKYSEPFIYVNRGHVINIEKGDKTLF